MIVKQEKSFPACKLKMLGLVKNVCFSVVILDYFIIEKTENRKQKNIGYKVSETEL